MSARIGRLLHQAKSVWGWDGEQRLMERLSMQYRIAPSKRPASKPSKEWELSTASRMISLTESVDFG